MFKPQQIKFLPLALFIGAIAKGEGYCNWNSCNGVPQGGPWCNENQAQCEICGQYSGGQWCANPGVEPTSPPTPAAAPMSPTTLTSPPTENSSEQENGELTWWTDSTPGPLEGSSCGLAAPEATELGSNWLLPYVSTGNYCAVSDDIFDGGAACGKCFRISFDGEGGTNPGVAGTADIQVVNSGAGGTKHFDCFHDAFLTITGASTGIFPVSYEAIDCVATPTTVVILEGDNAWYVKVLVAGGKTGVSAVVLTIGSNTFTMDRVGLTGTWEKNGLGGHLDKSVKFDITYSDGAMTTLDCFDGVWPVITSSQCVEN